MERPTCPETQCCGHAFKAGDEENLERDQVELCADLALTEVDVQRAWNKESEKLVFGCIEGAKGMLGASVAFIAAVMASM